MKRFLPAVTAALSMAGVTLATPPALAAPSTSQTFSFTGAPATWNVPSGVNSVYIEAVGAPGGADSRGFSAAGNSALVTGVLSIPQSAQQLTVNVGGAGENGSGKDAGGRGGWNGGADGGSGSEDSEQGGGGGGATDIRLGGTALADRVIVAGGGGGGGGHSDSGGRSTVRVADPPGDGGNAWPPPGDGQSASGSDAGSGGAGSSIDGGSGTSGGDAGDLSKSGGGGGGAGGYEGGAGGGAGQGDWYSSGTGSGGGGGAGSSYADSTFATAVQFGAAPSPPSASATINWVALANTPLPDFEVGTQISPVQMQGQAPSPGTVDWSVTGGALPAGISISESGQLSGTPTQAGPYDATITGSWSEYSGVSSSLQYSGVVSGPSSPGAPTALAAAGAASQLQAQLDWTAPNNDGGHPIQNYWVRYSTNNAISWSEPVSTGSSATSASVAVPAKGTYLFQVAAANQYARGPWSAQSSAAAVPSAPSTPSKVKAVSGFESVALAWTAPTWSGESAVTDYEVRYSSDGGDSWSSPVSTGSDASNYVYTGLTDDIALIFSVRAVNTDQTGDWSDPSNAVTPETLPTAPSALTGEPGNRAVALQWTAPQSFGGETLLGYRIQIKTRDQGWAVRVANTNSSATQASVTELINGVGYDFRVAAVTTGGVGAYSQPTTVEVPFTQPSRVPGATAQASDAVANLTWRKPERDNGSPITGYRIEVESGSGWLVLVADTGSTGRDYSATGLTNGKSYRFRVAAINAAGAGKPSPSTAPVTPTGPPTAPSAPQFVQVLPGKARAQVSWRPASSAGTFPVTGYAVQVAAPGGSWTDAGTTAGLNQTVRGLDQKTTYTFRVAATSEAGNGPWSTPVEATTSRTPSAPILRQVRLDAKKARVRLDAGSLGYQQFQRRRSDGTWRTLDRRTVTLKSDVSNVRVRAVRSTRHSDPIRVRVDRQWRNKPLGLSVTIDRDRSHIDAASGGSAYWRYRSSAPWTAVTSGDITLRAAEPGWHLQLKQTKGQRRTVADVAVR